MKLSVAVSFLSLPLSALAFTGPITKPSLIKTRVQPLQWGFITDLFKDRSKTEEEASAELIEQAKKQPLKKAKEQGADLTTESAEQTKRSLLPKDDGIFAHPPSKEMTGVEPEMTRLCSTISSQLYSKSSLDEFKLSTADQKAEALLYDDHGKFKGATVPFAVVHSGDSLILGWRGTNTMLDTINDAAASPQSSLAWRKHAKTVKVQGAFTSIVQNDISNHEDEIIRMVKEKGIKEIITTGQSLGGGAAQVGHLILRAQMQDERSPWNEINGDVSLRSVAFCAPMTTVIVPDDVEDETDDFVKELWDNSCNMIYSNDVVPRGYGYLTFINDFVEDAEKDLVNKVPIPGIIKKIFDLEDKLEGLVDNLIENNDSLGEVLDVFSNYRHLGKLVYYEKEDSKPRVLKDMGAFYENPEGDNGILRDVPYKPVGRKESVFDEAMKWHMDIINGPGLSYPESELS